MSSTHRLFGAISQGDLQTTRQFLEGNDDVGVESVHYWNLNQGTPLHHACRFGEIQISRYLIHELKANVDAVGCYGWTPLYQTCYRFDYTENAMELVELLLTNGANSNAKALRYDAGSTALHQACQDRRSTQLIQLLLDHGASINAQDGEGRTPLHHACTNHFGLREDVIKLLLASNADRHILNYDEQGPRDVLQGCHGEQVVSKVFSSYDTLSLTAGATMEHIQGGAVGLLNPHLSQHQHALAIKAILLVRKLPVYEVACEILGFLTPAAVEKLFVPSTPH